MAIHRLTLNLLQPFEAGDWAATANAFAQSESVELGQHWLAQREPNFRSARVSAGWTRDALWIYAQLEDDDIYNAATGFNQNIWELGDCFEIFLRPAGGEVYYEFHVSPDNQVLQLRWPDAQAVVNTGGDISPFLMQPRRLQSQVQLNREQRNWRAFVGIDWDLLGANPQASDEPWRFSFGRYDATRGSDEPVLSSSSPHAQANFHRQHEWGELRFEVAPL